MARFTPEHRQKLSEAKKGKKLTPEHAAAISKSLTGKKRAPFTETHKANIGLSARGRVFTPETRKRMSEAHKGEKSYQWKGGKSKNYKTGYYSFEYREWRKSVFERDGFTCQKCGFHGSQGRLNAHHIKSFASFPELRFDLNNGMTLCEPCHSQTDNFKGRGKKSSVNETACG